MFKRLSKEILPLHNREQDKTQAANASWKTWAKAATLGGLLVGAPFMLLAAARGRAGCRPFGTEGADELAGRSLLPGYLPSPLPLQLPPPPPPPPVSHVSCRERQDSRSCAPSIIPPEPLQAYLAACMVIRDDPDFPEWVTYHRRLGVGAFYIYDHNSSVPLPDRVSGHELSHGDVRYQYINHFNDPRDQSPQMAVYHECLQVAQHHPWIAFIDVDEYIVPQPGKFFLSDYLRTFEGHCALTLNWRVLGSAGLETRPETGVVESYTKCVEADNPMSWWTKVIVNPQYVKDFRLVERSDFQGPHKVNCLDGHQMVSENRTLYDVTEYQAVMTQDISLYHYVTRSREDFEIRVARGEASAGELRDFSYFDWINSEANADCFDAQQLARLMG